MSDPTDSSTAFCERFLQPGERARAVSELEALGAEAIPLLGLLFSGEAKNAFGISYSTLGAPIDCALVVLSRIECSDSGIESHLRGHLRARNPYAPSALAGFDRLSEDTIHCLEEIAEEASPLGVECRRILDSRLDANR